MAGDNPPLTNKSSSSGSEPTTFDPYFIHHSDHPGLQLVSVRLNSHNYSSWCRAFKVSLNAKSKLGFINGTLRAPSAATNPELFASWERCNDMVLSWIWNSLEPDIHQSVLYATTAREVWTDLEERFARSNAPRIYQIRREIASLNQGQLSVNSYYTKLKGLWDELGSYRNTTCTCGVDEEQNKLMQFLMGLNDSYNAIRAQLLLMNPLPSVRQAYASLAAEETHREVGSSRVTAEPAAMVVRTQERPHDRTQVLDDSKGSDRPPLRCHYCNDENHLERTCWKKHGYPEGHPRHNPNFRPKHRSGNTNGASFRGKRSSANHVDSTPPPIVQEGQQALPKLSEQQYQQIVAVLKSQIITAPSGDPQVHSASAAGYSTGLSPVSPRSWIIDSGATDHITSSIDLLTTHRKNPSLPPLSLPSGEKANIASIGTLNLNSHVQLQDVLCVPTFKVDLLSVSKVTEGLHCSVTFFPTWCVLQDLASKMTIGVGKRQGDLYYLTAMASTLSNHRSSCNSVTVSANLWHRRLGHPSTARLHHLGTKSLDISFSSSQECHVCPLAKQTRQPFGISSISTSSCFSLLHCDIWGPHKTASLTGAHYFLTIVDDYSRFTWIFLMRHKHETQSILKSFFAYVETQFHTKVQCFRSDNGGEFLSLRDFFRDNGILFQHSCVYTPQQNGVVERKHRHLLEVARALRFQSHLPIKFWGECVLTSTYLINRLPTPILKNQTPYELLHNKPPTYSHMRVFGCLAYATSVHPPSKFSPRAHKCVFIGYPPGQKAYKLYDLDNHKVFTNRDVIFHESTFPFFTDHPQETDSQETDPLFPPLPIPIIIDLPPASDLASPESAAPSPPPESTLEPETSPLPTHPAPRRSTRVSVPNVRLHDYVCSQVILPPHPSLSSSTSGSQKGTRFPLCNFISYHRYSPSHLTFVANMSRDIEPSSFAEADRDPDWRAAMDAELAALSLNRTWTLMPLPPGKRPIDCKWVYKIKRHADGSIERYKARLVAKGFTQAEGIDYHETFSPTAKMITVRCLLAIAASQDWFIHQMDVHNAFLHGDLDEEIYMIPPPGLRRQGENMVCRLHKSLYGLKQASRQWFAKFTEAILASGFTQSKADYSLFTRKEGTSFTALLIYVDDFLVMGNDTTAIDSLKKSLHARFRLKDLGDLKYFLGIEVSRSRKGINISQRKYALEIIKDCGYLGARPVEFPMEEEKLSNKGEGLKDPAKYRRLVGRLIYLTITRPDITYSVHVLSRFMHEPRQSHMDAALRVVKYLKNAPGQGLFYSAKNELNMVAYCDSDWGGCPITRRSTTGYCVFLGTSLISWRTKRQKTVSRSSAEAEYRSMAGTSCEVTWLRFLMNDLHLPHKAPSLMFCDNQAALHIAANPVFHERTRHIEIDCHFIRDKVMDGTIATRHVSSSGQLADLFTKPLGTDKFSTLLRKLGVLDIHSPT